MTVEELLKSLKGLAPETLVVVAKDGEGNGFSPLAETDTLNNAYVEDSSYSGEVRLRRLTDELRYQGYTEEDLADDDAVDCIVLWPTN